MSLRWRATGELLCGSKSEPLPDDTFIDDRLHHHLAVMVGAVWPSRDEAETGLWLWNRREETLWGWSRGSNWSPERDHDPANTKETPMNTKCNQRPKPVAWLVEWKDPRDREGRWHRHSCRHSRAAAKLDAARLCIARIVPLSPCGPIEYVGHEEADKTAHDVTLCPDRGVAQ